MNSNIYAKYRKLKQENTKQYKNVLSLRAVKFIKSVKKFLSTLFLINTKTTVSSFESYILCLNEARTQSEEINGTC